VALVRRCLLPAGLYFIVWAMTSQQSRFLISILPLLSVAAAVSMSWAVAFVAARVAGHDSGPNRQTRARVVARVLGSACVAASLLLLGWSTRYMAPRTVRASRALLTDAPDLRTWAPHPVYVRIRSDLPASARIVLLDTNQGFFVDRDYLADSFFEASQLNELITAAGASDGLDALFARLGATHVLVEHVNWVPYPQTLWDYLGDPARARELFRDGSFTLYEIRVRRT
jgi:hypothetical protein